MQNLNCLSRNNVVNNREIFFWHNFMCEKQFLIGYFDKKSLTATATRITARIFLKMACGI